jgi:hypothetical protein
MAKVRKTVKAKRGAVKPPRRVKTPVQSAKLAALTAAIAANTREVRELQVSTTMLLEHLEVSSRSTPHLGGLLANASPLAASLNTGTPTGLSPLGVHAYFLLGVLKPKSSKRVKDMKAEDKLTSDLNLSDINLRVLTKQMDRYVHQLNEVEGVTRREVDGAKHIRGELQLLGKKIDGTAPDDTMADLAIKEPQGSF